jgi:hypothetical protein
MFRTIDKFRLTVNVGLTYQMGTRPYDKTDRLGNLWVRYNPAAKKLVI